MNSSAEVMRFRMIRNEADGNVGADDKGARWRVGTWAAHTYFGKGD